MNQKCALKGFQIVVHGLCAELPSLTFQKVGNGFSGKGVAYVIHEVDGNSFKQSGVADFVSLDYILQEHRIINICQILH